MEGQRNLSEKRVMQLIGFPVWKSLILCIAIWAFLPMGFSFLCQKLPSRFFNYKNALFRTKSFEKKGGIYKSIFKIHLWKVYLPDGAGVTKSGYTKKHLTDFSNTNLALFLEESCRAELGHLLGITPFWIFGFFLPPVAIPIMLIYALIVNVPCILAQRYNRPRILELMKKREQREEKVYGRKSV